MNPALIPVAPVVAAPEWFPVQIRYRYEKKVAEQLAAKGLEVFLPLRKERHDWSDRQKLITIPLFPGYLFVRHGAKANLKSQILPTVGFLGFIGSRGTVTSVPHKQIEDLRALLEEEVPFSLYPFVEDGKRVRVRGGCLHGLEGLLLKHDKDKLVISIASVQRSLAIQVQGYELEFV